MKEKLEKFIRDQIDCMTVDLERILSHAESGDYTVEEISAELREFIEGI